MPGSLRTTPQNIAAVGFTVDGREITEQDIDDIVETYNPEMYGARINLDHYGNWGGWAAELSGIELNGCMLGDVISVAKGKAADGTAVLTAILCPNESLLKLNQADQAVYYSIEIARNFMESGKTYLTGLAMTDYPASTRTTRANFSKDKNQTNSMNKFALALDPALGESNKPFSNLFKHLFASKKDEEMKPADISAAIQQALGEPLAQFSSALTANTQATNQLLESFGDQNGSDPKDPGKKGDNASDDTEEFGDQNGSDPKGSGQKTGKVSDEEQNAEFSALNDKFSTLESKVDKLTDAFAKALNTPADTTTASDEEHDDETGKYNNLL